MNGSNSMPRNDGFTLLEMLVALAIFAIIGVMSTQLLTQMVGIHDRTTDRGERLSELQRAMTILERDVEQVAYRYVRDELGDPVSELTIGGLALIELTRQGWQNPLGAPRSDLQRVAYFLEEKTLYRVFWPVLDRAPDTEPVSQALLTDVEGAEFLGIDRTGNEHSFWPLLGEQAADPERQLAGIELKITVAPYGELERVWTVPAAYLPESEAAGPGAEEPDAAEPGAGGRDAAPGGDA